MPPSSPVKDLVIFIAEFQLVKKEGRVKAEGDLAQLCDTVDLINLDEVIYLMIKK